MQKYFFYKLHSTDLSISEIVHFNIYSAVSTNKFDFNMYTKIYRKKVEKKTQKQCEHYIQIKVFAV